MADTTRKALIVGIDYYTNIDSLFGCVNDAQSVKNVLERHSDGTPNFGIMLLKGTGANEMVTRTRLKEAVRALFADDNEIALFYFADMGTSKARGLSLQQRL